MSKKRDSVPEPAKLPTPERPELPEGSALSSVAWIVILLALIPLLMAAHGDGLTYLWVGLVMAALGAVLLVIGKVQTRKARQGG